MIKKEWTKVELLSHVRHDWLNKLQLIKGNLDLNKIERTKEIISEIVIEAQNETKLSNLHLPNLTLLLIAHNWGTFSFKIEFEVLDYMKQSEMDDQLLTNWIHQFFLQLNASVKPFAENHLSITIEPQQRGIRFFFDFCGTIEKRESIQDFMTEASHGVSIQVIEINDEEFSVEVFFQQNT